MPEDEPLMRPFDQLEEASSSEEAGEISLEEALARVDPHGHHARLILWVSLASVWVGGMGGAVAPFLMSGNMSLTVEGHYSTWATSMLASSMFIGMWIGSFVGGVACDAIGPGRVMQLSLLSCCRFVLCCE